MKIRITAIVITLLLLPALCACADGGDDRDGGERATGTVDPTGAAESPAQPPTSDAPKAQSPESLPSSADTGAGAGGDDGASTQAPDNGGEPTSPITLSGEVVITFDYSRQSGAASNQHAVWIEDTEGNVVRSLFASRWTANGGYKTRPDSIALWAQRAGLAYMSSSEVDAVSGATPQTGQQSYTWDLTDSAGNIVPPGDYILFVEGTLRWKNFVLYSGVLILDGSPYTLHLDATFTYEGDGRYAALNDSSSENEMIGPVTAVFTPAAGN